MTFKKNQLIRVPCSVAPGPLDESLVTVDTVDGPICGFVKTNVISTAGAGEGFIVGRVIVPRSRTIEIRLPGSFFATTGLVSVRTDSLHSNAR